MQCAGSSKVCKVESTFLNDVRQSGQHKSGLLSHADLPIYAVSRRDSCNCRPQDIAYLANKHISCYISSDNKCSHMVQH